MTTLTHADLTQTLADLDRQHAQALANLNALDGARQLARQLLAKMEEGGAEEPAE